MSYTRWPNASKGDLVFFSEGIYSDYGVIGTFKLLKDLNEESLSSIVEEIRNEDNDSLSWAIEDQLVPKLVREGFLEEINCVEINIGRYRLFD